MVFLKSKLVLYFLGINFTAALTTFLGTLFLPTSSSKLNLKTNLLETKKASLSKTILQESKKDDTEWDNSKKGLVLIEEDGKWTLKLLSLDSYKELVNKGKVFQETEKRPNFFDFENLNFLKDLGSLYSKYYLKSELEGKSLENLFGEENKVNFIEKRS